MKITALLILLSGYSIAIGQQLSKRHFSFGYAVGAEIQSLSLGITRDSPAGPYVSAGSPGFGAESAVWGQWNVLPALNFRAALGFSYSSNIIRFYSGDGRETARRYTFAEIELPVHFLITRPLRRLPAQSVVLFGGRVSWNMARNQQPESMRLLPERVGLDLGLGAGFAWGTWLIQPELLYSFGMNNLHDFTNNEYDWVVGRVLRDCVRFRLVFGKRSEKR